MRLQITNDNSNRLEKEIRQFPILSGEENLALLKQYSESGDTQLRETIFKGNARLIWLAANQYKGLFNTSKEELWSIGSLALLKAIDNYRLDAGYMFSPYAKQCIMNEFNNEVKHNGNLIRIKSKTVKQINEPGNNYSYISINEPVGDEGTLEDIIPGEPGTFDEEIDDIPTDDRLQLFWNLIKDEVKPEYYDIARAIWSANTLTGAPIKVTATEVGEMFNCTKQNIQHKKNLIINKLRKNPKLLELWKLNFMDYK